MSALNIILIAFVVLLAGYHLWGRLLERVVGTDMARPTPAHVLNDDIDYSPTPMPVLAGSHLVSISGGAAIAGPVLAVIYGWMPVLLWILLGAVFLGGVHDFLALSVSARSMGRTVGDIIRSETGTLTGYLFLFLSWSCMVLTVAAFTSLTARTFAAIPSAGTSSILFLGVAALFAFLSHRGRMSLFTLTMTGIVLVALSVWTGILFPLHLQEKTWVTVIAAYLFAASVTPVWMLVQPRNYLVSFLLPALLIMAVGGIAYVNPPVRMPAWTSFSLNGTGPMFPVMFITVACGAVSGFNSLVASGTTVKQLDSEGDARAVGYGSMMIAAFLAVTALVCAAVLYGDQYSALLHARGHADPVNVFATSIAALCAPFGLDFQACRTFVSLAAAAFTLATLDTAARLSRLILGEMLSGLPASGGKAGPFITSRYVTSALSLAAAIALLLCGPSAALWNLSGSANLFLAAMALMAVTVWLARRGCSAWFARIPMYMVLAVTLASLLFTAWRELSRGKYLPGAVALFLVLFALLLARAAHMVPGKKSGGRTTQRGA